MQSGPILVVDDDDDIRDAVVGLLRDAGHPVVTLAARRGNGRLSDSCCPVMSFFAGEASALGFQRSLGLTGEVLSMSATARAGALVFSGLLADPTP